MPVIARIIVSEVGVKKNQKLFTKFIAESKKILSKGEKHQFVLLPGGFLTFPIDTLEHIPLSEPNEKVEKQEWKENIEALQIQALTEFRRSFGPELLKGFKSVARFLVVGIDSKAIRKSVSGVRTRQRSAQFVLVYDLQSGRPFHWTGKTLPTNGDRKNNLIQMPIDTHFIRQRINGKKVAVFGCHDLSIFNQRHQRLFSPFGNERRSKSTGKIEKRKENTPAGKIKCPFIDATLEFCPDIMLQLPHDDAGNWAAKWTKLNKWLQRKKGKELSHFATGVKRSEKNVSLSGTQSDDVVNFSRGKWIDDVKK